jgi:hypothetical protein
MYNIRSFPSAKRKQVIIMICSAVTSDLACRTLLELHGDGGITLKQAIKQAVLGLMRDQERRGTYETDRENFEIWLTSEDRVWFQRLGQRRNTSAAATARFLANGNLAEEIGLEYPQAAASLGIELKVA